MAQKTPFKVMSKIQIRRSDNMQVIERIINLSQVVEDAIIVHLITNGFAVDSVTALLLINQWRIADIWIDEPIT